MICERALQPAGNYPTARPAGKRKIGKNRPRTSLLKSLINVPKVGANLVVQFRNGQWRLLLYPLPPQRLWETLGAVLLPAVSPNAINAFLPDGVFPANLGTIPKLRRAGRACCWNIARYVSE
jgi:hypothetical protein